MTTLAITLFPNIAGRWYGQVALVVAGSLAFWLAAKVQLPVYPGPLTLQTFVLLTGSVAYGWRLALATVGFYLLQGAVGLPVFAGTPEKGLGLAYMMGTTGGYLVGYMLAAVVIGYLAELGKDRGYVPMFMAMLVGNVLIYAPGLWWLQMVTQADWGQVFAWGLTPFLWGDLAKALAATALVPTVWRVVQKYR